MGALATKFELTWRMRLCGQNYTTLVLVDNLGRRWGWAINAAEYGWTAHVGDWGQAQTINRPPLPDCIEQTLKQMQTLEEAKAWIEQEIANMWGER